MRDPNEGAQWEQGGTRYTVNPTDDPKVGPDGYYLSQTDLETGDKATAVYNGDGTFADVPANRDWQLPSPQ